MNVCVFVRMVYQAATVSSCVCVSDSEPLTDRVNGFTSAEKYKLYNNIETVTTHIHHIAHITCIRTLF